MNCKAKVVNIVCYNHWSLFFFFNSSAGIKSQIYYTKISEWNAPFNGFFLSEIYLDILNCVAKFENYCPNLKDRGNIVMDEVETFEGQFWRV